MRRVLLSLIFCLAWTMGVGLHKAYRLGEATAEVETLRAELAAARRATDVEYFARQCDREKRELLDRCGVSCSKAW